MRRWALSIAALGLGVWSSSSVRAGDEQTMAATVTEHLRAAAAEADALDAIARSGDRAQWARAREQYLARLETARTAVEDSVVAWLLSGKPDPYGQTFLPAMEAANRLGEARLVYRVFTERATKGDADAQAKEFGLLAAGLAGKTLQDGVHGGLRPGLDRGPLERSAENLRALMQLYIESGAGMERPWPQFSGKALLMWLVATNKLDRAKPESLALLFSPGDATRSIEKAGGVKAYDAITLASLRDAGRDFGPFTSYAARAVSDASPLAADGLGRGAPVLADVSFPDAAVVAFTSGAVRILTKKELGLEPLDPLVVGLASKSPILRTLSDK
jgi:hypothetical protein